jgi:hypothetical protein
MGIQAGTYGGLSELLFQFLLVAASFLHVVFTSQLLALCKILIKRARKR